MRFLCLHGNGSSARIFDTQLSALQRALGSRYEFVFIQGEFPSDPGLGVDGMYPGPYYSPFDLPTKDQLSDAHALIDEAWESDGPFDGLVGFSQGGSTMASYLLQPETARKPFKCAVFFCSNLPFDPMSSPWKFVDKDHFVDATTGEEISADDLMRSIPEVKLFDTSRYPTLRDELLLRRYTVGQGDTIQIDLPTVHVYASNDSWYYEQCIATEKLCQEVNRETVLHKGGHSVPWDAGTTTEIVDCIQNMQQAVDLA
ncbi:hypothetical protein BO94DRAFT_623146 [Aspergillus sclerotioniger CBS 115572]|uniref:Serine hydrolase domain-containing protein n=1 Tax=Aspergillus sclerotioniger CBS 115572 TaxID=1450535 RepID=A0A317WV95_9EURO|nr:hypothetical protein BO94DRAFT_623146 [Aspergillus sclerotioniger CBS 115572]PWY90344.1 hypothetical protein BO94DRAFT_623146 [Aspergillus sclerotioniger CBS 115572]